MAKKSFKDALNKTHLTDAPVSGIKAVFSPTINKDETVQAAKVIEPEEVKTKKTISDLDNPDADTRQTFIISGRDMETLKNYIYFKKSHVDPYYSQKEALHQALELLFSQEKEIPERPNSVKLQEMLKTANIKKVLKMGK